MSTANVRPTRSAISSRKFANREPAGPLPTTAIRAPSPSVSAPSLPSRVPGTPVVVEATCAPPPPRTRHHPGGLLGREVTLVTFGGSAAVRTSRGVPPGTWRTPPARYQMAVDGVAAASLPRAGRAGFGMEAAHVGHVAGRADRSARSHRLRRGPHPGRY